MRFSKKRKRKYKQNSRQKRLLKIINILNINVSPQITLKRKKLLGPVINVKLIVYYIKKGIYLEKILKSKNVTKIIKQI